MLRDEFNRLMGLFHDAAEGKPVNLEEVFKQSLAFFEHVKEQIASGSAEDKTDALKMMTEMYQQMILENKRIAEHAGMTEEQLMAFAENPANFSPEQWRSIQESKDKIRHAGEDLAKEIKDVTKKETPAPKQENKSPKDKKTKKSHWMRS